MAAKPAAFDVHSLPFDVTDELAAYIRTTLGSRLGTHVTTLTTKTTEANQIHKDSLQDVQSQLSNVIEPTAVQLLPIAEDLKKAYEQIDLLEALVTQVIARNIKDMTMKLERTEQLVRREERTVNDGRHVDLWKGVDMGDPEQKSIFSAADYFEPDGRLKKA